MASPHSRAKTGSSGGGIRNVSQTWRTADGSKARGLTTVGDGLADAGGTVAGLEVAVDAGAFDGAAVGESSAADVGVGGDNGPDGAGDAQPATSRTSSPSAAGLGIASDPPAGVGPRCPRDPRRRSSRPEPTAWRGPPVIHWMLQVAALGVGCSTASASCASPQDAPGPASNWRCRECGRGASVNGGAERPLLEGRICGGLGTRPAGVVGIEPVARRRPAFVCLELGGGRG